MMTTTDYQRRVQADARKMIDDMLYKAFHGGTTITINREQRAEHACGRWRGQQPRYNNRRIGWRGIVIAAACLLIWNIVA